MYLFVHNCVDKSFKRITMYSNGFPSFYSPPQFPKATPPPPSLRSPMPPPSSTPPPPRRSLPPTFPPPPPCKVAAPPPAAAALVPPPPHITPPPPAPHHTVIIIVFVSLGGLFFLACLATSLCCFLNKKKKEEEEVQENGAVNVSDHLRVHEIVIPGPHGEQVVAMSIDEDINVQGMMEKDKLEVVDKASGIGAVSEPNGLGSTGSVANGPTGSKHHLFHP